MKSYTPIDCSAYDQLEALATLQTPCSVRCMDNGTETQRNGIISDIFTRDGAEYLKLHTGEIIRLDSLISVNGLVINQRCTT
jgi:Rho-binding antiterminator